MNPLVVLAVQELPSIIARLQELRRQQAPNEPPPTDQEVIDAYNAAFASSLAKDELWLAAHPAS